MKKIFLFLIALSVSLYADPFPKNETVAGKALVLNGTGLYEVSFLAIDIYTAALYLEAPSKNAKDILSSKAPKLVVLKFERDGKAEKLVKGWNKGFAKVLKEIPADIQKTLEEFNTFMRDVKEGETLSLTILPDKVLARFGKEAEKAFVSQGFSQALLTVWLGEPCLDQDLKAGMLGTLSSQK